MPRPQPTVALELHPLGYPALFILDSNNVLLAVRKLTNIPLATASAYATSTPPSAPTTAPASTTTFTSTLLLPLTPLSPTLLHQPSCRPCQTQCPSLLHPPTLSAVFTSSTLTLTSSLIAASRSTTAG